jgi:hypothetical protein
VSKVIYCPELKQLIDAVEKVPEEDLFDAYYQRIRKQIGGSC